MAKLKRKLDEAGWKELGEEAQAFYKLNDETKDYELDDDVVASTVQDATKKNKDLQGKVDEFRQNNIDLKKQVEEFQKKFEGIDPEKTKEVLAKFEKLKGVDPDEYAELKKKKDDAEQKRLLDEGKLQELIEAERKTWQTKYDEKVQDLEKTTKDLRKELSETKNARDKAIADRQNGLVSDAFFRAGNSQEIGLQSNAVDLVMKTAQGEFEVKDDGSVAHKVNGQSVDEYLKDFVQKNPYLVKPSQGGGTPPGRTGGMDNGQFVLNAEQAKDPALYRRTSEEAKKAGKTVQIQS